MNTYRCCYVCTKARKAGCQATCKHYARAKAAEEADKVKVTQIKVRERELDDFFISTTLKNVKRQCKRVW